MTMLAGGPALARAPSTGTVLIRQARAEVMKIRTTNTWWLFLGGVVVFTAAGAVDQRRQPALRAVPAAWRDGRGPEGPGHRPGRPGPHARGAGRDRHDQMMTAGQFFGVLFAMLIGVLTMTNEVAYQTATATFLANPRRAVVIVAKLAAAAGFGALFWLVSTVIDAVVTPVYLHSQHISYPLAGWTVTRSVLLNLLAYVMWAVFGLGLGTLVRSQLAAVITGLASYLVGYAAVEIIFHLIYAVYRHGWVLGAVVIAPAVASKVMITPGRAFPHAPPQWAGLLVMAGYAAAFGVIGVAVTRQRDVT